MPKIAPEAPTPKRASPKANVPSEPPSANSRYSATKALRP